MPKKPKLPRVPLPRQTGGAHKTRKNELARKAKHKGKQGPGDFGCFVYQHGRWS